MTSKPLRPVTPRDIEIVQRFDEHERHFALLALVAETPLPAMKSKTLSEIAALLPDADDADPLAGGTAWKDATKAERAPILARLTDLFAEHISPDVAPAAPVQIEYADVAAPVTVRLAYPFAVGGNVVREVSLRPPRYGDVEGVLAGRIERTVMIAEMSGLSVDAINALRWPDAERVVGVAMDMAPQYAGA